MKTNFLLPNRFKKVGWILLVPATILGIMILIFEYEFTFMNSTVFTIYTEGFIGAEEQFMGFFEDNYINTIASLLFLTGAIFVAFSEEKQEDEFISKTRLESLVWAIYVNYGILAFCTLFFFGFEFLYVLILNMFTILIFFIIRFNYVLKKATKSMNHEE